MNKILYKTLINKRGLTLVEVLAAMIILSLLVGPFLAMFVFSAKTNVTTQNIVNATYVAQQSMEELYYMSTTPPTTSLAQTRAQLVTNGYVENVVGSELRYTKSVSGYNVRIIINTAAYSGTSYKVVVEVFRGSNMEVKMENIYIWE